MTQRASAFLAKCVTYIGQLDQPPLLRGTENEYQPKCSESVMVCGWGSNLVEWL